MRAHSPGIGVDERDRWVFFSEFLEHEVRHCCCCLAGAHEAVVLAAFEVSWGDGAFEAGAEDRDYAGRRAEFKKGDEVDEEALAGIELQG